MLEIPFTIYSFKTVSRAASNKFNIEFKIFILNSLSFTVERKHYHHGRKSQPLVIIKYLNFI